MMMYEGTLLAVKTLEPSGSSTKPTHLVTVLDADGEPLRLAADEDASSRRVACVARDHARAAWPTLRPLSAGPLGGPLCGRERRR